MILSEKLRSFDYGVSRSVKSFASWAWNFKALSNWFKYFFLKLKCGRTLLIYPPHNHRQKWQAPCMSQQKQTGFILVGIIRLKYTIVCLLRYKSIRNNVLSFPRLFEPFCFIFMYISKMLLICTGCKSWLQMMWCCHVWY